MPGLCRKSVNFQRASKRLFAAPSRWRMLVRLSGYPATHLWLNQMTVEEFDEVTQNRFIEEDREAWNSICTILMGIICVGLLLAALAVTIVL